MNRAAKGGWEFLEQGNRHGFTWNPASGCSISNCAVKQRGACWAEKIVKRLGHICPECPTFKPHIHWSKLNEPMRMKKSAIITPVSTGDLFGLAQEDTERILTVIKSAWWHTFAILTKAPQNAHKFGWFPKNVWFGVSVNEQADVWRLDELQRIDALSGIKWAIFEPLYSEIDHDFSFLNWIIIGAQSRPEFQPDMDWVNSILDNAPNVPIYMKSNLNWAPMRREYPKVKR